MDFQLALFLTSSIIGMLIGIALLSRILTKNKADFFLGLVVLILAIELFFSWGARSGFNNTPDIFPYWMFLNYLIIPPCIWLYVKYHMDDNFQFQPRYLFLFLPALASYILEIWAKISSVPLMEYSAWIWFSQYLPLVWVLYVLGYFWISYYKLNHLNNFKSQHNSFLTQLRFMMLMTSLTIMGLLWLIFEFIGFEYFEFIEYTFIFLFLGFAFFKFLEGRSFPLVKLEDKNQEYPHYDDQKNLALLEESMRKNKLYLKPSLPLKELALELNLPTRYVSFLINHYHKKNYKEYINQYRIDAFVEKIKSGENKAKTLLGLAFESGFSSKSTFNQVFKNHMGKSPSEYLNQPR